MLKSKLQASVGHPDLSAHVHDGCLLKMGPELLMRIVDGNVNGAAYTVRLLHSFCL